MSLYRIYPTLWEGSGCTGAVTVYAVDRQPPSGTFPTSCSQRPRSDPAYTWDSATFQRLLPSPTMSTAFNAITWSTLTAWISWVQTLGYALSENTSLMKLKPYGEFYIVGP